MARYVRAWSFFSDRRSDSCLESRWRCYKKPSGGRLRSAFNSALQKTADRFTRFGVCHMLKGSDFILFNSSSPLIPTVTSQTRLQSIHDAPRLRARWSSKDAIHDGGSKPMSSIPSPSPRRHHSALSVHTWLFGETSRIRRTIIKLPMEITFFL